MNPQWSARGKALAHTRIACPLLRTGVDAETPYLPPLGERDPMTRSLLRAFPCGFI